MGVAQDLVSAGFGGYQGWNDAEALADYNATGGSGKQTGGGGSGSIPAFNYDYAKAATDAYGELGPYYTKLLTDSKGDINLALSRLIQDYDTGVRTRTQASQAAQGVQDRSQNAAETRVVNNANARGLYTRSMDDPTQAAPVGPVIPGQVQPRAGGFGIADQNLENVNTSYGERTAARNTSLKNFTDLYGPTGVKTQRAQTDAATKIQRTTDKLDQERKIEAGNMANSKGQQAYSNYLSTFSGG